MREVATYIFFIIVAFGAMALAIAKKISNALTIILLTFSLVAFALMTNINSIAKLKWSGFEIENFQRDVTTIKNSTIDDFKKQMEIQIGIQKKSIRDLITAAGDTQKKLEHQSDKLDSLMKKGEKTAYALTEEIKSQLALKEYLNFVTSKLGRRTLDEKQFLDILKEKPKGTAELWYQDDDPESLIFVHDILSLLIQAGWTVTMVKPISFVKINDSNLLLNIKNSTTGIEIISKKICDYGTDDNTAICALTKALMQQGRWGNGISVKPDTTLGLRDNYFVIAVLRNPGLLSLPTLSPTGLRP